MRILFAHCFYRVSGGEDRHVRDQVDLVSRSHEVELIAESNARLSENPATAGRMVYSHAKHREVGAIIDRFTPDVVHVHNNYPSLGPAVILAARERGVPLVMTVHNLRLRCPNGLMFTEGSICRRCQSGAYFNAITHACFPTRTQGASYATALWVHRFVMRLDRSIARFVVPSEFMRRRLLEWGIRSERVRLIRHFEWHAKEPIANTEVGSYGIFVGRLSAEKGLEVLLKALRLAGDPPFLIVGDGPLKKVLNELARRLGLINTRFHSWSEPEVRELVAAARYVAIPAVSEESASMAALQGLLASRPLLVSDRGALPELVGTGAGLLCHPGDETDLAEKIVQLMEDDDLCRRASREAASLADEVSNPHRHLTQLEDMYREVASTN